MGLIEIHHWQAVCDQCQGLSQMILGPIGTIPEGWTERMVTIPRLTGFPYLTDCPDIIILCPECIGSYDQAHQEN